MDNIQYNVNLVEGDETYNSVIYEELPLSYQKHLDEIASKIFDPVYGKVCIYGPKDSGKTFLLHQFVSNVDRYLDKLNKSKMVFIRISSADIRKLEMSRTDASKFLDELCIAFNCEVKEICFVGSDETAIEGIYRVFDKARAIFEIDSDNVGRIESMVMKSFPHIDVPSIQLQKSQLIKILNESTVQSISEIFKVNIDKKTISAFINYVIRYMPEVVLKNAEGKVPRDPIIIPPAGIWAKALRRIGSIIALSESPDIRKGDEIVIAKVIAMVFEEFSSNFEDFIPSDEEENSELQGMPSAIQELLGVNISKKSKKSDNEKDIEFSNINELYLDLKNEIIGQDLALEHIVDGLVVPAAGLNDKEKPIRSFLLLGPTGTGKTKTALTLAERVFAEKMNVIRLDMSEFGEAHEASKLIGSPPGYVGHETGGMLTNAVAEHPNSLILLDEIEKAHPKVWDSFLQVFDAGRMTDSEGVTVDFSSTIIVMTSNAGVDELTKRESGFKTMNQKEETEYRYKKSKDTMIKALESNAGFRKEFINRIDEIIVFKELSRDTAKTIIEKELAIVANRMSDQGFILNNIDEEVFDAILELSDFKKFGAREVQRVILRNVSSPIARKMINITQKENESSDISVKPGDIVFDGKGRQVEIKAASDISKASKKSVENKNNRTVATVDDLVALEEDNGDDCIFNISVDNNKKIIIT